MKLAIHEQFRADLDPRLPDGVQAAWYTDVASVASAAHDADVLVIGYIDGAEVRAAIEAAPRARWIGAHAAGVDHFPLELLRARNALLTKGAGLAAVPIAEFVVLCVLSAAKSFPFFVSASERGVWPVERPPATELFGSRALIVGYGSIGRAAGERLRGLGVHVSGVRRSPDGEPDVIAADAWQARLGEFDWIVLTTALTSTTRHLIGAEELARMQPGAWLVNIARGPLIDHAALADALRAGRPRGAYLDVTDPEPLPANDPLWSTPNVIISGHSAGRSARSRERYVSLLLDNLSRFQAGQPLKNLVNYSVGY